MILCQQIDYSTAFDAIVKKDCKSKTASKNKMLCHAFFPADQEQNEQILPSLVPKTRHMKTKLYHIQLSQHEQQYSTGNKVHLKKNGKEGNILNNFFEANKNTYKKELTELKSYFL